VLLPSETPKVYDVLQTSYEESDPPYPPDPNEVLAGEKPTPAKTARPAERPASSPTADAKSRPRTMLTALREIHAPKAEKAVEPQTPKPTAKPAARATPSGTTLSVKKPPSVQPVRTAQSSDADPFRPESTASKAASPTTCGAAEGGCRSAAGTDRAQHAPRDAFLTRSVRSTDASGIPLCSPPGDWWVRADYLVWWTKESELPPLVTTSPVGVVPPGTIGAPTTTVLFGDDGVNGQGRSGVRARIGRWLDSSRLWGVEAEYFMIGENSTEYFAESTGVPVLARPFFDTVTGQQTSLAVAYPNLVAGNVRATVWDDFQSTGVWARRALLNRTCESCGGAGSCGCGHWCRRLDLIAGYRYYNYSDNLVLRELEISTDQQGLIPPGTVFQLEDSFRCRNEFHGGDLGLVAFMRKDRWSLELSGKVAVGNNRRVVSIHGATDITIPGSSTLHYQGGLLALSSNSGTHVDNEVALIPELGVELGCQVTPNLRAYVGYNILYWTQMVRPGQQIDLNINSNQIPPPVNLNPPPVFQFNNTDFWAQGLNVGGELRF
jgi:hypothetical protein